MGLKEILTRVKKVMEIYLIKVYNVFYKGESI